MARLILLFGVSLLLGLGGGTGLAVVRARGAHLATPSDSSTAPESTVELAASDSVADPSHGVRAHHEQPAAEAEGATPRRPAANDPHTKVVAAAPSQPEPTHSSPLPAAQRDSASPSPGGASTPRGERVADARNATPEKPAAEGDGMPERRLAKIFGAMKPQDAARVLEQMDDSDVRTILGYLGDRQAAAILGSFPPQRAAVITRLAMRSVRAAP